MHVTATERQAEHAVVMRMEAISKAFAGVQALDAVDLDVRAGEVLALLGENGAGKSTLLKILNGDYLPDRGRMLLNDKRVSFASPHDAHERGVRVIYQEPEIIPSVTVAENVYVGALPQRGRFYDRRGLTARVQADIDRYGFSDVLHPSTLGGRLSPAQRQLVEILRALVSDVHVIAFDEPTSSLSDHEVSALFTLIRRLREDGVAVIYVSHRMQEVFQVSDRVTVLRDGKLAGTRITAETEERELIRLMVGRDLGSMFVRETQSRGEVVLQVRALTSDDVQDVTFEVRAGEVVGLAGLVGAGRTELAKAIAGDLPIRSGEVVVAGRRLRLHQPRDAIRAGVGLAPEERKADALLLKRSVRDNVSLAILDRLRRFRVVRRQAERETVRRYVDRLRIRTPSIEHDVSMLSGGNQQKTVLARWLARQPKVLILDEPTRGIDVGAKAEIYSIISDLAAQGVAVLLISSELPEIIGLADRIVVMRGGHVTGELDQAEATEETVLALAMAEGAGTREREEPKR